MTEFACFLAGFTACFISIYAITLFCGINRINRGRRNRR